MALTAIQPQPMFNSYGTPEFTYGSVPGDASTGFYIRDIVEIVESITPNRFDFMEMFKKGAPRTQHRIDWLQDRTMPLDVTASVALTAADTTLTLAAGDIKVVQQWAVFQIDDEIVVANGAPNVAAGTIPIVRAQGGTTAAAHVINSVARMIGTAIPQETDFVFSPTSYGDFDYNYFQRFQGGIAVDLANDVLRDEQYKNGNQLAQKLAKEAIRQKEFFNRALMYGKRQPGTPDPVTGNRRPGLMSGVPDLIRSNVRDLAGAALTFGAFEEGHASLQDKTEMLPDTYIMSFKTKRIISRLVKTRDATMETDRVSYVIKQAEFDSGVVNFVGVRDFPEGLIIGLRKEQVSLIPKKGLDWHERDIPVFGDHKKRTISADYSVLLEAEESCIKYTNFDQTLSAYVDVTFGHA